ncbi:hypothetical protein OY671_011326, partial [Metschnikowia pulcherrima]
SGARAGPTRPPGRLAGRPGRHPVRREHASGAAHGRRGGRLHHGRSAVRRLGPGRRLAEEAGGARGRPASPGPAAPGRDGGLRRRRGAGGPGSGPAAHQRHERGTHADAGGRLHRRAGAHAVPRGDGPPGVAGHGDAAGRRRG